MIGPKPNLASVRCYTRSWVIQTKEKDERYYFQSYRFDELLDYHEKARWREKLTLRLVISDLFVFLA